MHNLDQCIELTAPDKCILLCSYEYKKYSSDMFWYKHTIFREDNIPGSKLIANDIICRVPRSVAYYRPWNAANNILSLATGCKLGIFCSLKKVHFYQNMSELYL